MARIGLRHSAFDELRKTECFPRPAYINSRTPVWRESEIDRWIDDDLFGKKESPK